MIHQPSTLLQSFGIAIGLYTFFISEVNVNNNVVKFRKKFTLEQEQINFLKQELNILVNDVGLLKGYITKPYLGSDHWNKVLDVTMEAAARASIEWLINDLTERDVTNDENAFNMYSQLIDWFKNTKEGYHFAITMYDGDGATIQYIFLCASGHRLALVAIYDDEKDMVSGIIQVLNQQGMTNLGYSDAT